MSDVKLNLAKYLVSHDLLYEHRKLKDILLSAMLVFLDVHTAHGKIRDRC